MKVNEFFEKQSQLNITNSNLKNDTKINETLLDVIYSSLESVKNKPNMVCNVILLKIPDENNINIQMSGSTSENTANCYTQLSYAIDDSKKTYTGVTLTNESDSYKITIQPSASTETNTTKSTTGETKTTTDTQSNTTSLGGDSIKAQLEKIMYTPARNQIKPKTESTEVDEILMEEINRIKNIMYL